jgi:hypothetical protein
MTVATDPRKTGITGGMTLLAASGVAASVTGTLSETVLATIAVPGGAMGLNGGLLIYSTWTYTNSANSKTLTQKFGGSTVAGVSLTTTATFSDIRRVRNRGVTNVQTVSQGTTAGSPIGSTTVAPTPLAIDTTATQNFTLSGTLANTGETITLESYEVWLVP